MVAPQPGSELAFAAPGSRLEAARRRCHNPNSELNNHVSTAGPPSLSLPVPPLRDVDGEVEIVVRPDVDSDNAASPNFMKNERRDICPQYAHTLDYFNLVHPIMVLTSIFKS